MAGLTVVLDVATGVLSALNGSEGGGDTDFFLWLMFLASVAYGVVGAFIASRHPENTIGWLLCLMGLAFGLGVFAEQYAVRGLVTAPGSLPGATWMAWVAGWILVVAISPIALLFLLFPSGRVPSRRWRPVVWIAVAACLLGVVATMLNPKPMFVPFAGRDLHIPNPTGIDALRRHVGALLGLAGIGGFGAAFASVVALALRYRRSRGEERQQIRWLRSAAITAAILFLSGNIVQFVLPPGWRLGEILSRGFPVILTLGIPAAFGVAILKYRLYDIDRIVNRGLVYLTLTALLVGVYLGAVLGLGAAARSVTGQPDSAVVVAGSTLLVAALFRPARRRVQSFIDRRFYRRKYDAVRTLQAFSARLRDEVDLDELSGHLVAVVRETMQPAHVSLWLRGPAA